VVGVASVGCLVGDRDWPAEAEVLGASVDNTDVKAVGTLLGATAVAIEGSTVKTTLPVGVTVGEPVGEVSGPFVSDL
jgi:hypothetical protein